MSKAAFITQKPEESPYDFHERLCEACRIYTPINPEGSRKPENGECSICRAIGLRHSEEAAETRRICSMGIMHLMELAQKVYVSRDRTAQREEDQRMKKKAALLAAALGRSNPSRWPRPPQKGGTRGWAPLARDQCANCKRFGHWKNECPHKGSGIVRPRSPRKGGTRWVPLAGDQCANCKRFGHWKNECPHKGSRIVRPGTPRKGGTRGQVPLARDQCANCKRFGHWKNECPHKRSHLLQRRALFRTTQQKPEAQELVGLAGIESELGQPGSFSPREPIVKMEVGG
ncbi:uncharacterized protein LOC142874931 isoform X2 [Microcebus murinus]|uniref:uncharacterized protein LOC142874931 isoform X2 n=1 Tax=Microcebus murinus TaxID=30608 RepID=UPI003F6D703B